MCFMRCREGVVKKRICFCFCIVLLMIFSTAQAKPRVTCRIKEVKRHQMLVTYEWTLSIDSDKAWDVCEMTIIFLDRKGKELFRIQENLKLKIGRNDFTGNDICDNNIWKRIDKYVTTLDCIF